MRELTALVVLFFSVTAWGAINVPSETEPYQPIVAQIESTVPEGATFNGGWTFDDDCQTIVLGDSVHIWAPPGNHNLKYSGFWVHTESITFTDGTGKEITIQSYLGSGQINEEAGFKVLGDTPTPGPPQPPGPKPGQKYQMVFFVVADNLDQMPEDQRYLITSLNARKDLHDLGHKVVQVVDDDQIHTGVPEVWVPWVEAVLGDPLPRVALAPMDGGPITDYPLPANWDDLLKLLGGE